jgi:hypothetical protein
MTQLTTENRLQKFCKNTKHEKLFRQAIFQYLSYSFYFDILDQHLISRQTCGKRILKISQSLKQRCLVPKANENTIQATWD